MNISIIGSGYVGLGTAIGFMNNGHTVKCIDNDRAKVKLINNARPPVYEDGLDEFLSAYMQKSGDLIAYWDYHEVLKTDITFICVETPSQPDGSIDLTYIESAIKELGEALAHKEENHVVVVKSTVVPGTTQRFIIPLFEKSSGKKVGTDLGVVVNPEFLREGEVLHFSRNPFRIVIGVSDEQTANVMEDIYKEFSVPIVRTDITTAEMIKYASNTFLATRLSFINEIGNICKKLGVDVEEVAHGMGYDPRIGDRFLRAGVGFGGSCLPKDVQALICSAKELGYETALLQAVSELNKDQPLKLIDIARERLGSLKNKVITVLGLAFKPNTDDIRQAPAITIIAQLLADGARVKTYDPRAMPAARAIFPENVEFCNSTPEAVHKSDCVLIVTEWDEFKDENLYTGKLVIDGRRALDPDRARMICDYEGICW